MTAVSTLSPRWRSRDGGRCRTVPPRRLVRGPHRRRRRRAGARRTGHPGDLAHVPGAAACRQRRVAAPLAGGPSRPGHGQPRPGEHVDGRRCAGPLARAVQRRPVARGARRRPDFRAHAAGGRDRPGRTPGRALPDRHGPRIRSDRTTRGRSSGDRHGSSAWAPTATTRQGRLGAAAALSYAPGTGLGLLVVGMSVAPEQVLELAGWSPSSRAVHAAPPVRVRRQTETGMRASIRPGLPRAVPAATPGGVPRAPGKQRYRELERRSPLSGAAGELRPGVRGDDRTRGGGRGAQRCARRDLPRCVHCRTGDSGLAAVPLTVRRAVAPEADGHAVSWEAAERQARSLPTGDVRSDLRTPFDARRDADFEHVAYDADTAAYRRVTGGRLMFRLVPPASAWRGVSRW